MSGLHDNLDELKMNNIDNIRNRKNRRRSSFFQRRLSTSPSDRTINEEEISNVQDTKSEDEYEKLISQYISELKKENDDWKNYLVGLKKETNELKKNRSDLLLDADELLSAEQKQFLEGRPDLVRLARLMDSAAESSAMKWQRAQDTLNQLNNLKQHCSQVVTDATEALIDRAMRGFDEFGLKSIS